MKIVYCLPDTYKPGGIERMICTKANYLADKMNYHITIITTGQLGRNPFYNFSDKIKFVDLGINYDETLKYNLLKRVFIKLEKSKLHKKRLSAYLEANKTDIVISTLTHEANFLPSIKDGSKKILEFHFFKGHKRTYADSFRYPFLTKMAYYFRTFIEENFIVKKYDQFVVLTEEDKSSWQPKVKNVIAIPNIIPFENVNQSVLQNKQVIAVGRLDAQKGFDKLIHIWKQIADMFPDWKLTIYGSGIDEDFLNALISKYKLCEYIQILPPTQNILEKYRESSVFVMTSRYEGMPMTMLEAMSVGLPCVSYNFKCGPKDIITDNVDGYIVDEDDDIKFTECLTELFTNENKRLQMGNAAYLNMMRYTKDNIMKIWVDLFTTILEK